MYFKYFILKDGKLNVEEFILAMHLCEMGQKGEPLPDPLPISLVPPSLRRAFTAANGSAAGTPGSVTSAPGSVMIMKFVSRALIGHLLPIRVGN